MTICYTQVQNLAMYSIDVSIHKFQLLQSIYMKSHVINIINGFSSTLCVYMAMIFLSTKLSQIAKHTQTHLQDMYMKHVQ